MKIIDEVVETIVLVGLQLMAGRRIRKRGWSTIDLTVGVARITHYFWSVHELLGRNQW